MMSKNTFLLITWMRVTELVTNSGSWSLMASIPPNQEYTEGKGNTTHTHTHTDPCTHTTHRIQQKQAACIFPPGWVILPNRTVRFQGSRKPVLWTQRRRPPLLSCWGPPPTASSPSSFGVTKWRAGARALSIWTDASETSIACLLLTLHFQERKMAKFRCPCSRWTSASNAIHCLFC